jgi:hypothetical protein
VKSRERRVIAVSGVVTLVSLLYFFAGGRGESRNVIYENQENGFALTYPADWTVYEYPIVCEKGLLLCTQSVEFKHAGEGTVRVFANFQGDWCTSDPPKVKPITVDGVIGQEYLCRENASEQSLIRFFVRGADGNVMIRGLGGPSAIRDRIVRSLRFDLPPPTSP